MGIGKLRSLMITLRTLVMMFADTLKRIIRVLGGEWLEWAKVESPVKKLLQLPR